MKNPKYSYLFRVDRLLWDSVNQVFSKSDIKTVNGFLEEIIRLGLPAYCNQKGIPQPLIPVELPKVTQQAAEVAVKQEES